MKPNFELLKDAYAIIDGIPGRVIDLDMWTAETGDSQFCGTIACAAGWLARHPKFNAQGLKLEFGDDGPPMHEPSGTYGFTALAKMFNLDESKSEHDLFNARIGGYRDEELTDAQFVRMSDKQLFKRRVLRLFQEYSEPFNEKLGRGLNLDARQRAI
ncbi:hypothetical protein C0Q88_07445 [Ralstonia pickettii]|uniref:Uncharacterized protein n=1 Tax=Ralstonia pickettii TaxID=329 RepID=A0A2N4TXS9_RALPI|nr:hypothetical protein [Ralstonia pickettii]PLC44505.1 hypothetical protein C0Q88_07445 [Ralstonia pickettii]